jgi:hypothetical protein
VKELELFGCALPDKFVAGYMIVKLPPSWTDFATSLKHKREEFSTAELVGTLDVADKVRAKDVSGNKVIEGSSSAHVVQKNHPKPQKKKFQQKLKQKPTTPFKKGKTMNKDKMNCFTYGKTGHFSRECPEAKWKPPSPQKSASTVETEAAISGYGKFLPCVFSVFHSPDWWVDNSTNIHVCADIFLFSFYQAGQAGSLLMGNGARAAIRGIGTIDLKLTSRKIVQLKNVHHVPSIKKNLISGSLLCRDGFKLVFESNKCVVFKFGTFFGKGYESRGLFRLSLVNTCFKSVNLVVNNVETNIWHSRLCHVNVGCMSRLARLSLISKFDVVKGSKCHVEDCRFI